MPKCPRLDPRPARPLTTREIAKVIGATIGTIAAIHGPERARNHLRAVAQMLRGEEVTNYCDAHEVAPAAMLFGQAEALVDWCEREDVLTAVEWWINKPGALESFRGLAAKMGALLSRGGGGGALA